jgi:hypothetical protein
LRSDLKARRPDLFGILQATPAFTGHSCNPPWIVLPLALTSFRLSGEPSSTSGGKTGLIFSDELCSILKESNQRFPTLEKQSEFAFL